MLSKCQCVACIYSFKTFFLGCGKHVDQVMKDVPEAERCVCPREWCDKKTCHKIVREL